MTDVRSPLKNRPLRTPGQSVQENIDRLLGDKVVTYVLAITASLALALFEWFRWYSNTPPSPLWVTAGALIVILFSLIKLRDAKKKLKALKLGRDGERIVAEMINMLRGNGAIIFHDVQAPGFNVDHLIIARQGIFVVETKTYSKRTGAKVVFDGKELLADGRRPDRDPIVQVRAISDWVANILRESTGKCFPVKPVVVFPGWWVNPIREQGGSDVWVLNPEPLPKFVMNEPMKIAEDDFRLAVFHMARIARSEVSATV